ncbi:MAG: TPM domain-containing protein [Bacteroidia bacterium]|nr:TPM domain-containing protein [Bacteroidia bacterium]
MKLDRRLRILAIALLILGGATALALEVPYLSGHINDTAHMLSQETVLELERMLTAYEDSTKNQIVLLTITSLGDESLEDYSLRVAETWKLGQKGVDNGILLLIAKDDRKLRIEVGYGLEASVTDAVSSGIINGIITPRFKQGDFEAGIRDGLVALIQAADGTLSLDTLEASSDDEFPLLFFLLFWFSIVGLFTVIGIFSPGCAGWFLYAFLVPFYAAPAFLIQQDTGSPLGFLLLVVYLVGLPILRILLPKTDWGKRMAEKMKTSGRVTWSSGGWSSSGSSSGWSSGGGSSFSGGGGSFGGGGSSGSW